MTNNAVFPPRMGGAAVLAWFAVVSVWAGQLQPDARAGHDSTSPAAAPDDEGAAVGMPVTPDTSVVTRWTVDSGGGLAATGGGFELSGTIGQPDIGSASGGKFTLTGGFWVSLADGDCNTDGGVDLVDFNGFKACLSGPGGGVGSGCSCFDLDQDNDLDLSDVAAFQQSFSGS